MNYGKLLQPDNFFMVAKHIDLAKKFGVTVNNTKRTQWYTWGTQVCGAIYWVGAKRARLKGIFVHPNHRGKRWGSIFTLGLIQKALEGGAEIIEAHVFNTQWYVKQGFILERKFKTRASDRREFYKVIRTCL